MRTILNGNHGVTVAPSVVGQGHGPPVRRGADHDERGHRNDHEAPGRAGGHSTLELAERPLG